jgi:hypothetical protein
MEADSGARMSDDERFDTGSKDRATVAIVAAEVREVKAIVSGHAELTTERFKNLNQRFDMFVGLPDLVTRLLERSKAHDARLDAHDKRFKALDDAAERRREWRIGPLVQILIGLAGLLVAVAMVYVVVHNGGAHGR